VSPDGAVPGGVLVTGGACDIGRAIGERLSASGVPVLLADLAADDTVVELDVTKRASVAQVMQTAWELLGDVHGLVNCATVGGTVPLLDITDEIWERTLDATLRGTWLCTQLFAQAKHERGEGGAIVNISSTASNRARPGVAHYASAKAGVNQLTRVCALELAPAGIRVNAVCPGLVDTRAVRAFAAADPREHKAKMATIPMGRIGRPEEIAAVAEFLLGTGASFVTGSVVFADGGYSCGMARY
jgi:NAD(P)-dependent dehydrogenase (short-subunit alcohol dehydrogenase family)